MAVRMTARITVLLAALGGLACSSSRPSTAAAAVCDRYAAPWGSDRASGTAKRPMRTVQRLADRLRGDQTGCLRAGAYDDEVSGPYVLRVGRGGRPGARIELRSFPGERAILRGIVFFRRGHFVLSGVDLDGRRPEGGEAPVSVQVMAPEVTIRDSTITNHRSRSCMILGDEGRYGEAVRTVVRRTVFEDCGDPANGVLDHAIYVAHASSARIVDNVFVRSSGWAVQLYPDARRTLVAGNVMWDNGGGVVFGGDGRLASSGNRVERNVIGASRRRAEITSSWGAVVGRGNVARENCLAPGSAAFAEVRGYVRAGNRVVRDAAACGDVVRAATAASAADRVPRLGGVRR